MCGRAFRALRTEAAARLLKAGSDGHYAQGAGSIERETELTAAVPGPEAGVTNKSKRPGISQTKALTSEDIESHVRAAGTSQWFGRALEPGPPGSAQHWVAF